METTLADPAAVANLQAGIFNLVLHADPIVKAVMALLVTVSAICWAIIFERP